MKKNLFSVIICGSRSFNNYELLREFSNQCLAEKRKTSQVTIVTGMAKGADTLAIQYAKDNGFAIQEVPALWQVHGKSAGYKRNAMMSTIADACIAFQINMSAGTQHMIETMRALNKPVRVKGVTL